MSGKKVRLYLSKRRFIFPTKKEQEACNAVIDYLLSCENKGKMLEITRALYTKRKISENRTRKAVWMLCAARVLKVWQYNACRWVVLSKHVK